MTTSRLKNVYISLLNKDTPNKIVINGIEISTEGLTYFALEMKPMRPVKYVIGRHGMKTSAEFEYPIDKSAEEIDAKEDDE